MTKEEIQTLYREKILPEHNHPFHFGEGQEGDEKILAYNPMCGDKYQLYLGTETHHFEGIGCAISKASTSLLMKQLEGKSRMEIEILCVDFIEAFESDAAINLPEQLNVLLELKNFDGRVDCIQLSWKAVLEHLKK